jgi:hypothetical protein
MVGAFRAESAIVLLAHQIDAAFWHEWVLFGLPGGIQFFLLLNLPIIALVLYGQRCLALGRPSGKAFSWALAASGLFAAVFHGFHLLRGDEAFRLPFSLVLLVATFVLSLAQALGLMFLKEGDAGDHRKGEI